MRPVVPPSAIVLLPLLLTACKRDPPPPAAATSPVPPAAPSAAGPVAAASTVATSTPAGPAAAPPGHAPPIDCPLRGQGVDPAHLQPFEDTEKYIAFLERADRAAWQKPQVLVAALRLAGTETVADVGAGSGYLTFPIARALAGGGRVVAIDVAPEMIRHIHHKAMTEGVRNVQVVLAKPDDPALPPGADLVLVCDVLHHVTDRAAWLRRLSGAMRPGARLALVEFREGALPEGPPESLKIPRAALIEQVKAAGLVLEREEPDLLPYQTFLVFRKPGQT